MLHFAYFAYSKLYFLITELGQFIRLYSRNEGENEIPLHGRRLLA